MGSKEGTPQFTEPFNIASYQAAREKSLFASYHYDNLTYEDWHAHPRAQLTYAGYGAIQIHTAGGIWTLPQGRALWIPARQPHQTHAQGKVITYNYYCSDKGQVSDFYAVDISRLAHILMLELIANFKESQDSAEASFLMEHLLKHELSKAPPASVPFLPLPRERRLKNIVQRLLENDKSEDTIATLGNIAGASTRTLSRLFRHDTGLTFSQWRHQLALMKSISLIAQGFSIENTAKKVGYYNGSTFNTMFRKTLGETPQRYLKAFFE